MLNSKVLDKRADASGLYVGAACVVELKAFDFFFRREAADFVPDPGFTPYFWRRKGDDLDDEDMGKDDTSGGRGWAVWFARDTSNKHGGGWECC
jgi:hypothetical protein